MTSTISVQTEAPENIFKTLRVASDLSHAKLAALMHINKHALIRLEQGLFERPLPTAIDFWLSTKGKELVPEYQYSELTLVDSYENFQEETRDQNRHYFGASLSDFCYGPTASHPGFQLIDKSPTNSVVGVAKALCIPQSTLNVWITKWRTQKSVPRALQSALLAVGYNRFEVKRFVDGYSTWREANK